MLRVIGCALLLAACASYQALPDLPLRYEQTRLLVFKSIKDDVLVERAFASGPRIVAVVSRPAEGVFASADGGASWAFSRLEPLREVIFDGERIIGRAEARLWRSEDGGRSWSAMALQAGPIDALALGADGAIYAAASGRLFASTDGGRAFRAISLQIDPPFRIRSIAPDPAQASTLYVSVRADPPSDFLARLRALLDRASDEALVALALVDRPDAPFRFGDARDGVYASYDRGGLWKKTSLGLDAWLVFAQGALHAVAADPLLEAAALSRRYPDLASALERQLHGDRADSAGLRAACRFPGRQALLGEEALVFRAAEAALSWRKLKEPLTPQLAVALHQSIERQRAAQGERLAGEVAAPPPIVVAPSPGGPPSTGPPGRGRGGRATRSGGSGPMRRAAKIFSPETVLSLLDPARLLAHYNAGLPLAGVAGEGEAVFAYVPSAAYWDLLAANMASASDSEGEISLGPGWVKPNEGGTRFELLRSDDGGASWSALPAPEAAARGVAPYPSSIAPALVVLSGREKEGDRWSALRRYLP
ncbi:MAG: hypothetical protein E6J78_01225 [Deltaproteobacteria bacterium]|nr:MAG: hypothetical protein E6J78_01225 [Deltaproteobacteria bacterium]